MRKVFIYCMSRFWNLRVEKKNPNSHFWTGWVIKAAIIWKVSSLTNLFLIDKAKLAADAWALFYWIKSNLVSKWFLPYCLVFRFYIFFMRYYLCYFLTIENIGRNLLHIRWAPKVCWNSDIRFYLVKSLISYQKVKNFGIYLRLEEFDHKSNSFKSRF